MSQSAPFIVDNKPTSVAPGSAGIILPPQMTFANQFSIPWHTWPKWADEALLDNPENARRMRNDPVISNPIDVRTRATVLQTWFIEPDDDTVEDEVIAAADIEWRLKQLPFFQQFISTLTWEGMWVGRSAAQIYYDWYCRKGITGLIPTGFDPINGDKLVFGFGDRKGQVGVRVHGGYDGPGRTLTDQGIVKFFDERERANLIVHRHNREDADYWKWQKAGSIEGIGLRDRLYWTWSLKNQVLAYLVDYLQWFARGLTVYYYEANNAEALTEVTNRIREHTLSGLPVLLFPKTKEGAPGFSPVERIEPGTAGNNLILELVTQYFDDLIRRTILGQDATTVSDGGNSLGDGRAQLHETTFGQVVKWDSNNLAETLSQDIVRVLYAYTYPHFRPGKFAFETEAPNVEQLVQSAETFVQMGGTLDADEFRKILGLPVPKPGGTLIGGPQAMQPAAVTSLPEGQPTMTPPDASGDPGETLQPGPVS